MATGVFEVLGILSFAWGAREGIAVTSVVSSQFAALAALGASSCSSASAWCAVRWWASAVLAAGVAMVALGGA